MISVGRSNPDAGKRTPVKSLKARLRFLREVRLKSAGCRRWLIKLNPPRSREMTLPEPVLQMMPSQWQQSVPACHDDKRALATMKEPFSWRREEACAGTQGALVLLIMAAASAG